MYYPFNMCVSVQPKGLAQLVVANVVGHLARSMLASFQFESP